MPEATSVSTYCFVAACKADTGSCVSVTEVSPARVSEVAPSEIEVVPIVTALLASDAFGMFDSDSAFVLPSATEAEPEMPPE